MAPRDANAPTLGKDHSDKKNARGPKWVSIGPAGADYEQNGSFTGHVRDSGRARTVLPHPTNADIVYVLTAGGGLWRTNNWNSPETNWSVLTDDLPTTGGGSVAFGRNPNTLYLGLGDPYDQILVAGAMTKSTNGGVSWSPIVELGTAVSDGRETTRARTATSHRDRYGLTSSRTTTACRREYVRRRVWRVRTSAGWLASAQPCNPAFVGVQCGEATTLYVSKDLGATWAPITNAGGTFVDNGRTTLGVAVPGDAVVYAYSSNVTDAAMKDVYRSSDGGQTWLANGVNANKIPSNPVAGSMPNMNICHAQCWYDQMILVDPSDPIRNTVWIGGDSRRRGATMAAQLDRRGLQPGPGGPLCAGRLSRRRLQDHRTPTIILATTASTSAQMVRRSAVTRTNGWSRISITRSRKR